MVETVEQLMEQIRQGTLVEHRVSNVELKSSWDQANGKRISAMANRPTETPHWMCLGVRDDGALCGNGEAWARDTEQKVSQHINQYLDPQLACQGLTCHQLSEGWIVAIRFANPGSVVYWNTTAYKASGTTVSPLAPEEAMQLTVSLPGLTDYSAQRWTGTCNMELVSDFSRVAALKRTDGPLASLAELPADTALERVGINNTNVARILFGDMPYRVVKYDRAGNPVANETQAGLYGLVRRSFIEEVQQWSKAQTRAAVDPYPPRALKEGLANAVAHAAYFDGSGDVIVEIWPDRISISNLCVRDSLYFANKWFSRSHRTLNRLLMETLRLAGIVDELGRGKSLIFSESLRSGNKAPEVVVEKGGLYDRWRLYIHGGSQDQAQLRVFARLRDMYPDQHTALIANALVLWRGHTVSDIRQYVDGESSRTFAEVLGDLRGPIFYYQKEDRIVLRRWVRVLLGEGKDSKQLSPVEEDDLFDFASKLQMQYESGYITPRQLRDFAGMGHTSSESVLSSHLLRKWTDQRKITKVRKGLYKFTKEEPKTPLDVFIKALGQTPGSTSE